MYLEGFSAGVGSQGKKLPLLSLTHFFGQVEELRLRIRELEEKEKKESKKMADEDALRKIKMAEEQIEHLQKKLAATKQVFIPGRDLCCPKQRPRAGGA